MRDYIFLFKISRSLFVSTLAPQNCAQVAYSFHFFMLRYSFSVRRRTNGKSTISKAWEKKIADVCYLYTRSPASAPMARTRVAWHGGVAYAMFMRCINGSRSASLRRRWTPEVAILRRAPSRSTMHFDKSLLQISAALIRISGHQIIDCDSYSTNYLNR